jgi:hypothetical protein
MKNFYQAMKMENSVNNYEIDQIISMPPLASAVQNFETSLLLISLKNTRLH